MIAIDRSTHLHVHVHLAGEDDVRDIKKSLATILQNGVSMNTALKAFIDSQTAFNTANAANVEKLGVAVTGLTGDIKSMGDQIAVLQNSDADFSAEDKAAIEALNTAQTATAAKLEAAATALAALDDLTPPVAGPDVVNVPNA